jgi:hypothetical protein
MLVLANRLIARAEDILERATTVPDAIHAALLALEAKELIGNRTPTSALEALDLQHRAEVTAECMFRGVFYNFEVKERLRDVAREVKSISKWFKRGQVMRRAEISARCGIVGNLTRVFRTFSHFDQENVCLAEMRRLSAFAFLQRRPWLWPFYPVYWYIQLLLRSLPVFAGLVVFWIVAFALVWWWRSLPSSDLLSAWPFGDHLGFADYLGESLQAFLTFESPALRAQSGLAGLLLFRTAEILGFIHLGVFISHIYTMLQRR